MDLKSIIVRDNVFDVSFLHEIYNLAETIPLSTTNIANRYTWPYGRKGTHRLLGATLFRRESLNRIITLSEHCKTFFEVFEMIEGNILRQRVLLNAISLNVQTFGQDGTLHTDSSREMDQTILWMMNPEWESSWGGNFQLADQNGNIIREYDFLPGRLIIFPSNIPHRGLAPKDKNAARFSMVFRVEQLKENYA